MTMDNEARARQVLAAHTKPEAFGILTADEAIAAMLAFHPIDKDAGTGREEIDDSPEIPGDLWSKVTTYNDMHKIAVELGFPSILEALESITPIKAPAE